MIDIITGKPNRQSVMREDVTIAGNLTVNGTLTVLNQSEPSIYSLGEASSYVILTPAALTIGGAQIVNGNVGQLGSPTPDALIFASGADYPAPASNQAVADAAALMVTLSGLSGYSFSSGAVVLDTVNAGFGTGIFQPGVYVGDAAASTSANGTVVLSGAGDYVFVFSGAMTTGANTIIALTKGATANRVFWVTLGAMTTGANTTFKGTSLSPAGQVTGANTNLEGRLLSTTAAISTGAVNVLNISL
jgi:hypothetical protein